MGYFGDHYSDLLLPLEQADKVGWRLAQAGAIHALTGHFYSTKKRALVAMPTGSGKSAVFMALPYFLRAERVLVLTTSRVVRNQLVADFRGLTTLKALGAIGADVPAPCVREITSRVGVQCLAAEKNQYDVVVAIPASFQTVDFEAELPVDLFDLIIVDEAHHLAAKTWTELVNHFENSKQALFTATPVRRDRKPHGAKYVFVYSLADALRDEVFRRVKFSPVTLLSNQDIDVAIAKQAEKEFRAAQNAGFDHRVLVRVDSKGRANALGQIYADKTCLRLKVIHSGHSYSRVKSSLAGLAAGELDGLIAVNMLGEGFDFPKLKIGAVHMPHKSLSATLQFIGRLARGNDRETGDAVLVGVENDIKFQARPLWVKDAAWHLLIPQLSDTAVSDDMATQEFFGSFDAVELSEAKTDTPMLAVEGLRPSLHAKVYELREEPDMRLPIQLPDGFSVLMSRLSQETMTRVIVLLEKRQPRWSDNEELMRLEYDLVVLHYHVGSKILFVGSSRKSDELYERFAGSLSRGRHSMIPLFKLSRALRGLCGLECFSVGMRNRLVGTSSEAYRIMVGPSAQHAIRDVDSIAYHRGHVFTRGERDGEPETLGYSASSKLWSATNGDLGAFVTWCDKLGSHMADPSYFTVDARLESLPAGRPATAPIQPIVAARWPSRVFDRSLRLVWPDGNRLLRDLDIQPQMRTQDADVQLLDLKADDDVLVSLAYEPEGQPFLSPTTGANVDDFRVVDHLGDNETSLIYFLRNNPPKLFTADFGFYCGSEFYKCPEEAGLLDMADVLTYDWIGANVDITCETQNSTPAQGKTYILRGYSEYLKTKFQHVFIDDGSGEAADIIACKIEAGSMVIRFIHCKAAGGSVAGHRVDDVYVVSGQVIKSVRLISSGRKLHDHLSRRQNLEVVAGNLNDVMLALIDVTLGKAFQIELVQPGISVAQITDGMRRPLAAARDYALAAGCTSFSVVGSQ